MRPPVSLLPVGLVTPHGRLGVPVSQTGRTDRLRRHDRKVATRGQDAGVPAPASVQQDVSPPPAHTRGDVSSRPPGRSGEVGDGSPSRGRVRGEGIMRHLGRHGQSRVHANEGPDARQCSHVWRDRVVPAVLADCECEVCDRCGALHIADTDELGGDHSPRPGGIVPNGGAGGLESLARRWSAGGAPAAAD